MIIIVMLSALAMGWKALPLAASETDNLRAKLSTAKGGERIQILENLFEQSLDSLDLDYQYRCVSEFLNEARRQQNSTAEIDALSHRAQFFFNNFMDDSVLTVVKHDMNRVRELEGWVTYYEMWGYVASTYVYAGQNATGINETKAMFADAKEHGNLLGMGNANCIMGQAYSNQHDYIQSVDVLEKSLSILKSIEKAPSSMPDVYVHLANALNGLKDYNRLEQLTVEWKDFITEFISNNHLENQYISYVYWSYYYLACVQADLGLDKLDLAEHHLAEASQYVSGMENQLTGKWLFYSAQLQMRKGNYDKALEYNTLGHDLFALGDRSMEIVINQQRADIMEHLGRYADAVMLYKTNSQLSDSLNAEETRGQLNEMNTIFQVGEKELENERLQRENERARFRFIIIVISVIVLSLAIFLYFRIRAARKLKQAHGQLQVAYGDLQKANDDLHQANLVIEETTAAKERIESELRIARDIQMGMVPSTFPEDEQIDLYASMTPAKEVGGDLYNFLLVDGKLYFALGDVSGKGVPASLFMAQATRLFRTLAKQGLMPAEIATRMNDELGEDNEQGMFVTMFLGLVDLKTGHLDFCNGGHNPPVVNNDYFMEMEPNAPIGLWPGLEYVGEEMADIRNTPIFVYTDGLNEAENMNQDQFGDDHLLEIMHSHPFVSSKDTVEMLKAEVEKHRNGADPNDDLTMLCVMVKGKK